MPDDIGCLDRAISKRLEQEEVLLEKEYTWESLADIEQDIFWALDSMPGEFDGTIKIKVIRCNRK